MPAFRPRLPGDLERRGVVIVQADPITRSLRVPIRARERLLRDSFAMADQPRLRNPGHGRPRARSRPSGVRKDAQMGGPC
jgi:hypothetical protein